MIDPTRRLTKPPGWDLAATEVDEDAMLGGLVALAALDAALETMAARLYRLSAANACCRVAFAAASALRRARDSGCAWSRICCKRCLAWSIAFDARSYAAKSREARRRIILHFGDGMGGVGSLNA